jgi:hypothetical protein
VLPLHSWKVSEVDESQGQAVFSELAFVSKLSVERRK